MPEKQNIEYKSAWHDDYLQWGSGIMKIIDSCTATVLPMPIMELVETYKLLTNIGFGAGSHYELAIGS